jgi:hypothetical protein
MKFSFRRNLVYELLCDVVEIVHDKECGIFGGLVPTSLIDIVFIIRGIVVPCEITDGAKCDKRYVPLTTYLCNYSRFHIDDTNIVTTSPQNFVRCFRVNEDISTATIATHMVFYGILIVFYGHLFGYCE